MFRRHKLSKNSIWSNVIMYGLIFSVVGYMYYIYDINSVKFNFKSIKIKWLLQFSRWKFIFKSDKNNEFYLNMICSVLTWKRLKKISFHANSTQYYFQRTPPLKRFQRENRDKLLLKIAFPEEKQFSRLAFVCVHIFFGTF